VLDDAVVPVKFFSEMSQQEVGVPIMKLSQNQQLHFKCDAQKGIGKMHAKWSPASIATFQHESVIELNDQLIFQMTEEEKIKFVSSCPTKVF